MSNQPVNVTIEHPISQALTYTKRIFSPLDPNKWLGLAFCAFLANCSKGGGGGGGNGLADLRPTSGGSGPGAGNVSGPLDDWKAFYQGTFELVQNAIEMLLDLGSVVLALIAMAVVVVVFAIRVLTLWLSARGEFMYMDGILHNRGNVVEPWKRFKGLANSLFLTRLSIDIVLWVGLGILGAFAAYGASNMSSAPGQGVLTILFAVLGLLVPGLFIFFLVHWVIDTLVIPAMYKNKAPVSQVWPTVKSELISGHLGDLFLYILVRFALYIAVCIAIMVVLACTCCMPVFLPPFIGTLVSTVLLLPFITFMRSHQLAFYEELTGSPMVEM